MGGSSLLKKLERVRKQKFFKYPLGSELNELIWSEYIK